MSAPVESTGGLSRGEKREMLRRALVQRISQVRTVPASFAQERLWFLHRMHGAGEIYNLRSGLRFTGPLNVAALERALGEIVRRHETLRTTFTEVDGAPMQVIAPFEGFSLPVEDRAGADEAEVRRISAQDARRPFDLAAGPLFRPRLLRTAPDEHVLLISMHHVVSDAWSRGVLFRELAALYAAYRDGRESPLPEPPVQYAEYAAWQREQVAGGALAGRLAWWKERLADAPALLELPTDHPRPAARSDRGAKQKVELPADLVRRLEAIARNDGATLYMVLLAAFQVLLGKYAATDDVVVGTPVAGRDQREVEELIGFFVNTLVLRTNLRGDPPFREVLRRVRSTVLDAFRNQDVPFDRLVAELHPERAPGHSPLFQVMFTLDSGTGPEALPPGMEPLQLDPESETAKFDLTLGLTRTAEGVRGTLEYSTDLFERATAERMVTHLRRLLEQVADDAGARLSSLELADAAERRRVVEEWNRTDAAYPADAGIQRLFAEQAAPTPDAVAVVCDGESLTYGELDARANRLANYLVRHGVGPESRVGICLERGPELVVAILGILKAGGAYVPLDPAYPRERLAFMLADSAVAALVTRDALRDALPADEAGVPVVSIDGARQAIAAERADDPRIETGPRGLAYVIYTSGSTGIPKGVAVEHRNVVRLVRGANYVELGPDEVVLQAAPVSFDASTLELWGPLLNGGRIAIVPGANPALEELGRTITRHRVTTLWLTAGLFQVMVDERLDDLRGVRQLLAGGDVLPVDAVRRVRERFPSLRLINGYGPTENTTFTCCHTVPETWSGGPVPIGTPISNTRVYVLDAAMRPVPAGLPGELYAGGDGVARGYLNRPAATAERFVPDPFSATPGARMYRTGDRARWIDSAEVRECVRAEATAITHALTHSRTHALQYLGRLDAQVKIRGFRIEPGEVETALRRLPGVIDGAVIVREDAPGEKRLVAYVVGDADADSLRARLRGSLPEYMLPAAFVHLHHLPLTPNGKVDRRALPAPDAPVEADGAPRTPVEEVVAGIWAEVLRIDRVGVTDDFFALGGHSLAATRVVSRLRAVFGVELPLRTLFESPTVAELARAVEEMRRAEHPRLPPIVPVERTGAIPLSFAQERLWFLDRLDPGSPLYTIPVALRLAGPLDAAALERALGEVIRRHEALRTVFREVESNRPVQVILPFEGFHLPVQDLSGGDPAEREAAVRRRASADAMQPFDLEAGPLFRPALLRLGADDHVLLLTMHHVVSDEWSMGVLYRELSALYEAYRNGDEAALPPLPVQYADYAAWERAQLRGAALERQLAWWRERLADAPARLELPTDRPRPAEQTHHGAREAFELSEELVERLRAVGRGEGATLFMVLLGAFQVLLARHAGTDDVVVGSPVAGRTRGEVDGLIGFFANTLVLRTDLGGDPAFREVLRRVRETTLGAYDHQEVPFERLVAELRPERSQSYAPLFQVMFSLESADGPGLRLPGVTPTRVTAEKETSKFDLTLAIAPRAGGMRASLEYGTELFDRATIQRMTAQLARVLVQVAADPDLRLSRLELLDDAERRLVVETWGGADTPAPDVCVHQRFEAQARADPHAVALVAGDASLTYGELDARANRLARRLRALGVGTDVRVALCAERGPEMVVALLAIHKAGGAYVPLDPAYPAGRLAFMLADSGAAVLLTQERLRGAVAGDVPTLIIDGTGEDAAEDGNALDGIASPQSLAYVIYTSGSTGTPKGVAVDHRAFAAYVLNAAREFGIRPGDRFLQFTSISFDPAGEEIFATLASGATLVLRNDECIATPAAFWEACGRWGITLLDLPTAVWSQFLPHLVATPDALPPELRLVVIGGEAADAERIRAWNRVAGDRVRLLNSYGPTETTIGVTVWDAAHAERDLAGGGAVPIGTPVPAARCYVLDAWMRPQPVGVPGELFAGGAQVARGYLHRPGLTAERFVPDPFASTPGSRLYRTGDRARWRADGVLEYMGRLDQQTKIRGFRVEPGEVEAALRRHPGVSDCAVVVREDAGEARLIAYVAGSADADALRAHLRASVPEYMVPAAFVALDALPLTPSGKLDRAALPAPDFAPAEARFAAPRTPTEELLAGVWADVLDLERVGVADDFFELGGHSLLATVVLGRIQQLFGIRLPVRDFFNGPTVAELAVRVDEMRRADVPQLKPVAAVPRAGALPLSFAQERLWFMDRLQPGSASYNVPSAMRVRGALDVRAMERALGEIVRRHEVLRTTFEERDGAPVQVIAPFTGFHLPVEDLSALDEAEREADARRRAEAAAERPFDLATGPLLRASLLRLAADDHVLLLSMHHIVSDEWSMGILFRELGALYAAFRDGRPSPLPEPALQYADFAAWERAELTDAVLDRQLAYWRERLADAPAQVELPTDRPRPLVRTDRGAQEPARYPAELLERLQALGRAQGATLYMVLLGAFQALLARYGGTDDVVVGSPIAGRTRREVEELVGFFINTLVMRTDLSGDPGFREVLRRVREVTLGAYEHQEVPFERLVAELRPERSLGGSPFFNVMFTVMNAEGPALRDLELRRLTGGNRTSKFDLTLVMMEQPDGLEVVLEYSTDLFDQPTAARILRHVRRVLEQVAANPDVRLSKLQPMDEAERQEVIEGWNATEAAYPADLPIHRLFEAQAEAMPDAVALVGADGETLTFRALNQRANRLAHHMVRLGVGPDARVGICLERETELIVSILAALKAGGAYLPLDPAHPAERLERMLADAGARVVITRGGIARAPEGVAVLDLDASRERIAAECGENPAVAVDPSNLAYVLYTSGSTGTPKGAGIEHRALVNHMAWFIRDFRIGADDRVLLKTPIVFDAAGWEVFAPLISGARLVLAAPGEERDPAALLRTVRDREITILQLVPTFFRALLDEAQLAACTSLRQLFCGGEALPGELARRFSEILPHTRLVNLYGPTECCIDTSTHVCGDGDAALPTIPIGRPVPNTRAYV
ncbi:MAG TPA: amino acid adenylation domain-containing protein, partial [Longimicrobium sp.]|nr:amino acid adenylation domain-containing protein [Longimicrobium sp.]